MRHSRGTNFSFFDLLLEIVNRNVTPDVTAKINEDRIDPFHAVEMCCKIIVVFDLGSKLLSLQPKYTFYKAVG